MSRRNAGVRMHARARRSTSAESTFLDAFASAAGAVEKIDFDKLEFEE